MAQIIAICIQKGGVGKTTVTINLGAALAATGKHVLLVDFDPQGHLTEGVGLQDLYLNDSPTLYDCLVGDAKAAFPSLIHTARTDMFSVIPSSYRLMLGEQALYLARNREHKLKDLFKHLPDGYDYVLIDCPPWLGNLTDNALNAARQVVIPFQAEATSVRSLELLFDQIESIERGLNIHVQVLAVVPNLVQDSAIARHVLADLRQSIPMLTPFELRKRVMLQAAWSRGCSIFSYQPPHAAEERIRKEIIDCYTQLARQVIDQAEGGGDNHG